MLLSALGGLPILLTIKEYLIKITTTQPRELTAMLKDTHQLPSFVLLLTSGLTINTSKSPNTPSSSLTMVLMWYLDQLNTLKSTSFF
jgi:hypothetical protein